MEIKRIGNGEERTCEVEECNTSILSRGMCGKHYQRWKKYKDPLIDKPIKKKSKTGKYLVCENCGETFYRCPSEIKKGSYKYCSRDCGFTGQRGKLKNIKPLEDKNWYVNRRGYLQTTVRRKRILRHRWVMEQHLGRKLKPSEKVRHLDGDKLNNDIDNLVIMSDYLHSKTHRQIMIEYGKALMLLKEHNISFKFPVLKHSNLA